jgi:5-formyltetrahydrofolate cyclo-ligase
MTKSLLKERLRSELLERRRSLSFEEVWRLSALVQKRFLASPFYKKAQRLSLYASFQNEVLTDDIFKDAVEGGKEVYYPRVIRGAKRHLGFFKVGSLKELASGSYDIPEPEEKEEKISPGAFDLVVVPGVAFDEGGGRLGYGKGYYDMALKGLECPVVALAYEFQVIKEAISVEVHDVPVEAVVTEERVIKTLSSRGKASK